MNPDKRSKRESRVEAITANDLLSIDAYTFAANSSANVTQLNYQFINESTQVVM